MDEFRWIQMFLCLMIQIVVSVNETSMFMKVGDDVTLLCLNVIDEQNNCDGTTWTFDSRHKQTTVELITLGQSVEEAETKSDRLSVTANCSLLIKKLTVEDVGLYYCQQYKVEETPSKHTLVHQSLVDLSVITSVTCQTSGDTKTTKKPARKTETTTTIKMFLKSDDTTATTVENESTTANNKPSGDSQHDAGLSLNPAETRSAPQTSQDSADPEVSYATISYTKTTNKDRVRGDDEGDAVTYSTVKAHSSSAAATADPSSLYSTVP
ncbi:unnamed protein product [Oreochromis niloticus]|nr:unnamed protein product [Mustela putorius furo]